MPDRTRNLKKGARKVGGHQGGFKPGEACLSL